MSSPEDGPPRPPRRPYTADGSTQPASMGSPALGQHAGLPDGTAHVQDFAEPLVIPDLNDLNLDDAPPGPPSYDSAIADTLGADMGDLSMPRSGRPSFELTHADGLPYAPVDYQSQRAYGGVAPHGAPGAGPGPGARGAPYGAASGPPVGSQRLSSGSQVSFDRGRPRSDPNDLGADFANLRLTSQTPPPMGGGGGGVQRQPTMINYQLPPGQLPPRGRSVTGGHAPRPVDPAASVYSLDSGLGAYAPNPPPQRPYHGGGPPGQPQWAGAPGAPPGPPGSAPPGWPPNPNQFAQQPPAPPVHQDYSNPYYTAATDFLGLPPGTQFLGPGQSPGSGPAPPLPGGVGPPPTQRPPSRQASMSNLARTNTTRSTASLSSLSSLTPSMPPAMPQQRAMPTESVGASSTRRRGGAVAIDVSKPPYTREFVDDYRNRMKVDPDPEAQFSFAKYLIEAAKKIGDKIGERDPRAGRKYRDSLLAESLRNIKKLAEGKEPYADAQFFLANLYGTGQLGLQVDHERAYYLYLMASKLNHPAATYRAAVCCEMGAGTKRDPNRSVLFYRKAAALGDTAAMYKLALILLNGIMGHPRNPREALVWLRRAASQADEDNPHALHELALLHERQNNGTNGVIPHDPMLAREYLTQSAQLGYAPSQFKMGSCHEFGNLGFPIDPRRSIAWYTRAAEQGDAEAELALSGWYLTGSEGVLKQSDTEAYLWGRKAANKGLAKAEYAVGYYTEIGIGVKQDIELAKRWYMRAASQNNKRAMQRLAELNSNKNAKGKGARPTRKDAEGECVVM